MSLACLLSVACVSGCGGAKVDPNRPKTVPVKGTVQYKGQPVEGATVTFMAQTAKEKGATGQTDAQGEFRLMTFAPGDGAMPGNYRVKISKTQLNPRVSEEQLKKLQTAGQPVPPPIETELLPKKFKSESTSGLTAEVKDKDDNSFTFDLTD
jgi:hypothetical protein